MANANHVVRDRPLRRHSPTSPDCGALAAVALLATAGLIPSIAAAQDSRADAIAQAQASRQQLRHTSASPTALNVSSNGSRSGAGSPVRREVSIRGSARYIPAAVLRLAPACGCPLPTTAPSASLAAIRFESFSRADVTLALPSFARGNARVTLNGSYIDAPDVRYFGVGE